MNVKQTNKQKKPLQVCQPEVLSSVLEHRHISPLPNKQISDDAVVILSRLELQTSLHSPHVHQSRVRARACAGTTHHSRPTVQGSFSVIGRLMHSRCSGARTRTRWQTTYSTCISSPQHTMPVSVKWSEVSWSLAWRCFVKTGPLFVTGWSGNQVAWKTILSFVSCQIPVQWSWTV